MPSQTVEKAGWNAHEIAKKLPLQVMECFEKYHSLSKNKY